MTGRHVVVTGGSGEIGRAVVRRFLDAGDAVLAHYRSSAAALAGVDARPGTLARAKADLRDRAGAEELLAQLPDDWDGVDVLVTCTGGARPCRFVDMDEGDWRDTMAGNVDAVFFAMSVLVPKLAARHGCVVNLTSVAALTGGSFGPHYAAAKAAVIGLTRSAARELGPQGVRVNAVAPGPVDSAMTRSLPAPTMDAILGGTALRRIVAPDEVADAVAFLAGAQGVTGQTLVIDAGRHFL